MFVLKKFFVRLKKHRFAHSLFFKERCKRIAQIAYDKRVTRVTHRNLDQIKNILTHYSVAQVGLNYEEKNRSKISLNCPFK